MVLFYFSFFLLSLFLVLQVTRVHGDSASLKTVADRYSSIGYQMRIDTCYQSGPVFQVAARPLLGKRFLPCPAVELRRWTFMLLIVWFFIVVH